MKYDFTKLSKDGIWLSVNSIDITGIAVDVSPSIETTIYKPGGVRAGKCFIKLGSIDESFAEGNIRMYIYPVHKDSSITTKVTEICLDYLKGLGLSVAFVKCTEDGLSDEDARKLGGQEIGLQDYITNNDNVYAIQLK